jgi:hypothetical protein
VSFGPYNSRFSFVSRSERDGEIGADHHFAKDIEKYVCKRRGTINLLE